MRLQKFELVQQDHYNSTPIKTENTHDLNSQLN